MARNSSGCGKGVGTARDAAATPSMGALLSALPGGQAPVSRHCGGQISSLCSDPRTAEELGQRTGRVYESESTPGARSLHLALSTSGGAPQPRAGLWQGRASQDWTGLWAQNEEAWQDAGDAGAVDFCRWHGHGAPPPRGRAVSQLPGQCPLEP